MSKVYKVLAPSITVGSSEGSKFYRQDQEIITDEYNVADLDFFVANGSVKVIEGADEVIIPIAAQLYEKAEALAPEQQPDFVQKEVVSEKEVEVE